MLSSSVLKWCDSSETGPRVWASRGAGTAYRIGCNQHTQVVNLHNAGLYKVFLKMVVPVVIDDVNILWHNYW